MSVENALDPGLAKAEAETFWYDIQHLEVEGRGWTDTRALYDRLPARALPGDCPPVRPLGDDGLAAGALRSIGRSAGAV